MEEGEPWINGKLFLACIILLLGKQMTFFRSDYLRFLYNSEQFSFCYAGISKGIYELIWAIWMMIIT